MTLLAFGLNHNTAPLAVRERVTFPGDALPGALADLIGHAGVQEAAILSTCNRTEIYCSLDDPDPERPIRWFSDFHGLGATELNQYLYAHPDAGAVKHVLRVASGLDSMVLGEPQVLGQLKSAYQTAVRAGSIGQLLNRLFQHSFRVAKEIRSNTAIGSHPVSIAFAATRLARQIFGELAGRTALLIGAGDTIELAAKHLAETGLRRMMVANRTLQRSQRLALDYSGYAITLDDIPRHLEEADIVISATGSPEPILRRETIEHAMRKRRHRPVLIVDIAVPRDVDPAAADLDDVYLYTVDDLRGVIEENLRGRREAAIQAEEIIESQVVNFMEWMNARDSVSTIRAMRDRAEGIRQEVLDMARRRLSRSEDPALVLQDITRILTNKLMHAPSVRLRSAGTPGREELLKVVRELYSLPDTPPAPKRHG